MKTTWILLVLSLMAVSCSSVQKDSDRANDFPRFPANQGR
jgi:hypothetical protein